MFKLNFKELRDEVGRYSKHNDRILAAALWYASNSIPVLPATKDGKLPKKEFKITYESATTSEKKIREWFGAEGVFRGWNISIPTGAKSNVCIVDIDNKNGKNGSEAWADMEAAYGGLRDDVAMARTPSGGIHFLFNFRIGFYSTNPADTRSPGIMPGVDTRGGRRGDDVKKPGGHFLVYPSSKETESGEKFYEWDGDYGIVGEAPDWVIDLINNVRPLAADAKLEIPDVIPAGARDSTLYNFGLRLVARGYTDEEVTQHMQRMGEKFDPPDVAMVEAKIRQVLSSELHHKQSFLKEVSGKIAQDKHGRFLPTVENYYQLLNSSLFKEKLELVYDAFKDKVIATQHPTYNMDDIHNKIERVLSAEFKMEKVRSIITNHTYTAMREIRSVDSLQDYFNTLVWDGVDRISVLREKLFVEPDSLHESYIRKWLVSGVARVYNPGAKVDCILVVIGAQGTHKSTFMRLLTPGEHPDQVSRYMNDHEKWNWFTDSVGKERNLSHPDELRKLTGKFIGEMAEMHAMSRNEITEIKHFLSEQAGEFVKKFKEDVAKIPRRFILGGTSNKIDYLGDDTGNRRFWNIFIGKNIIDTDWVYANRDQIWAQAKHLYDSRMEYWLSKEEEALQKEDNFQYETDDSWDSIVLDWACDKSRFSKADVLIHALKFQPHLIKASDQGRVTRIMTRHGWECRRVRVYKGDHDIGYHKLMINPNPTIDNKYAAQFDGNGSAVRGGVKWEPNYGEDDGI